jgi:phospholipid/cholesterol/gamma-HCH transport system substrate-binding protein
MARPLAWSDVRGGFIAICAISALTVVILKYARVGALRGDTITLYTLVGEARGVLIGSEVWLSGQKIGQITDIRFRTPSLTDTMTRVEITMKVLAKYRSALRRDAVAQIRNGGSIIGAPVVYMSPGTPRGSEIRDGDVIAAKAQSDVEGATAQFSNAAREFPVIINSVKVLAAQLQTTDGTVGALINSPDGAGMAQLSRTRRQFSQLRKQISADGIGSAARMLDGGLHDRASRVIARADSLRQLIGSSESSLGRLRRDSTLLTEIADVRDELSIVRALIDEPRGTAGRALRDSALVNGVAQAHREMTLLMTDIKKHPLRYIRF